MPPATADPAMSAEFASVMPLLWLAVITMTGAPGCCAGSLSTTRPLTTVGVLIASALSAGMPSGGTASISVR